MSTDLGNLSALLRLLCHECSWLPPDDLEMALVQAHYGMDHPTSQNIALDLLPVCFCGAVMEHTQSRPTGGGFKDYFRCPADERTGFIIRKTDGDGRATEVGGRP